MKHIKRIALFPMLLALLFALTACGLTPEKVLQKTEAAMAEQPLSGFHAAMETDVSVNVAGTVTEVKMSLGADILFSSETLSLYADVDIVYNDVAQSMQLYHLMENGKSTLYVYDPANDLWSRSASDITSPVGTPEALRKTASTAVFSLLLRTLLCRMAPQRISSAAPLTLPWRRTMKMLPPNWASSSAWTSWT